MCMLLLFSCFSVCFYQRKEWESMCVSVREASHQVLGVFFVHALTGKSSHTLCSSIDYILCRVFSRVFTVCFPVYQFLWSFPSSSSPPMLFNPVSWSIFIPKESLEKRRGRLKATFPSFLWDPCLVFVRGNLSLFFPWWCCFCIFSSVSLVIISRKSFPLSSLIPHPWLPFLILCHSSWLFLRLSHHSVHTNEADNVLSSVQHDSKPGRERKVPSEKSVTVVFVSFDCIVLCSAVSLFFPLLPFYSFSVLCNCKVAFLW